VDTHIHWWHRRDVPGKNLGQKLLRLEGQIKTGFVKKTGNYGAEKKAATSKAQRRAEKRYGLQKNRLWEDGEEINLGGARRTKNP